MNTTLSLRLLLAALIAGTFLAAHADEEQDLIATLQSSASIPQKCAACQKLRTVGTTRSIPALAALLGEERTSHAARYVLEGMPNPEAGAALRQALAQSTGLIQAGLADSLGWRQDAAAVPLLIPLVSGSDPGVAAAAAGALGKIGGSESLAALKSVRDPAPAAVRPVVLDSLLRIADQMRNAGQADAAAALFAELDAPANPASVRAAAWRGLVWADAAGRAERVVQALAGLDIPRRTLALKVVRELSDPAVARAGLRQWASLPAESQLAVLDACLPLGSEAAPAILAATVSEHTSVRIAAWRALGDFGDAKAVSALAKAAVAGDAAEREAARDTLARVRGEGVREAFLSEIEHAPAAEKAELLRALGDRGDTAAANVLVQGAVAGPGPVRLAALESLRKLAVAETITPLLDLAAQSQSDADREPVLKALFAVCQASPDKEQTARSLVARIGQFPKAERRQVLPLLAELGTPAALEAAQAAARDTDPELAREALRVLAQWPNAAPAASLLEMARTTTDPVLHTLAMRACIGVAGQEPDLAKRFAMLRQATAATRGTNEKKQALGQMGQIPTTEALDAVLADLNDPTLVNEAGLAALSIAEKLAAKDPQRAREVAAQVLARCKSAEMVQRAWALRGKPAGAGPFLKDWLVAGPFSQAGANDALSVFNVAFPPEQPGARVTWKAAPRADMIDLMGLFPGKAGCVAYLKTTVIAPRDTEAALLLGSDDGVKAWVNGAVVHSNNVDRGAVIDQDMAPIQLKRGANDILLKITQGGGGWAACARIVGTDGRPIDGLKSVSEPGKTAPQ